MSQLMRSTAPCNAFFVHVSGPSGSYQRPVRTLDETIQSGGGERSGTVNDIAQGQRFALNDRTDTSFAQGEEVMVQLLSYMRVMSYAQLMRTHVSAALTWYLEGIYLRVI